MFLSLNNSTDTDYVNINCILVLNEERFNDFRFVRIHT